MFDIYFCIAHDHRPMFILIAAAICLLTAASAVLLLRRAARLASAQWAAMAGAMAGFGVWSTHFVAMQGYVPAAAMSYRLAPTVGSLLLAMITATAGFALAHRGGRGSAGWAALITGGGIAAMHYLGTSALDAPVHLAFRTGLVLASIGLAIVPLWVMFRLAQGRAASWRPVVAMVLAVCGLHFTGMAALRLVPARLAQDGGLLISGESMAQVVGIAACLVIAIALITVWIDRRVEHAIHRSERDFAILVKGISDCALYMLTPEGRVASWNAGARRLKGYTDDEVIGLPLETFYTPEDRAAGRPQAALAQARDTGKYVGGGWRCRKDGSRFWAHVTIERINDAEGRWAGFAKITRDMTQWKADQDRLASVRAQLDSALDNMHQGLALFGPNGALVLGNHRLARIWGLAPDALTPGLGARDLIRMMVAARASTDPVGMAATLDQAMQDSDAAQVIDCGPDLVVSVATRALNDGGWVTTFDDITQRRRHEARIAHMAMHDTLTGLPNRSHFNDWCTREIEHAARHHQQLVVVAIDMDRFKDINDTWGHAEGDAALRAVAKRMADACQPGEVVARLGGDEFAAAAIAEDEAQVSAFVGRLAACFDAAAGSSDMPVPVAASFGIALYPDDGQTRETLLNNADLAMYRAKTTPGERICYYQPDMDEAARNRRQIAGDLQHAIARGELHLLYQPQHNVLTGTLTGYEALLRWHHPRRGLINPLDFIPIAEETGAIFAIGDWVLREAAREASGWDDSLRIAVNLSPVQLLQSDLVPRIMQVLIDTGLPARRLELEITESAIIADKARALTLLRQIKALGIAIAMDDFGTGYSSLDTLHSFPFDKIKIDKSFLLQSSASPQAAAIVRAVLALGRSLSIPVLAEGVETEEQIDLLRREGCAEAQGFLFGRPRPIEQQHTVRLNAG